MVGVPVIINHKDITAENANNERVGVVSNAWFDDKDGWYWCDGVIWDETAQNLITDKGWSVSCSYDVKLADDAGGTENNIPYDIEFLDGVFTHLAIVDNPRYERANIVFNSKAEVINDKWITIHPNGEDSKGRPLLLKDGETPKEAIERAYRVQSKLKDNSTAHPETNKLRKLLKSHPESEHYSKLFDLAQGGGERGKLARLILKEDWGEDVKQYHSPTILLKQDIRKEFRGKLNNYKEQDMALLDELKKLITKVENDKGEDMDDNKEKVENEKVDKRDIIRQIMAIAGKHEDNEDVRTIAKLAEKLAYDKSEAGTADNACDDDEEEVKNKKVKNEETEKDKEEYEDLKKDVKEDVQNKCKNSVENSKNGGYFDKMNEIYNSANEPKEENLYISREQKLKNAETYFAK